MDPVPVSAMPMLRMGALCFCGKSSAADLKFSVPSSFFVILKIRMASPLANQVMNALKRERMRVRVGAGAVNHVSLAVLSSVLVIFNTGVCSVHVKTKSAFENYSH